MSRLHYQIKRSIIIMWYISFIGYICWLCLLTITEGRTSPLSWPSCLCSAPASSPGARPPPRPCGRQKVKRSDVSGWGWGKGRTQVKQLVPRWTPLHHLWSGRVPGAAFWPFTCLRRPGRSHPCRCAAGQARRAFSTSTASWGCLWHHRSACCAAQCFYTCVQCF